jgi:hypothetical protein
MNYKILLKKYMSFICSIEGTDYMYGLNPDAEIDWNKLPIEDLSKEEMLELIRISDESFQTIANEPNPTIPKPT